MYATILNKKDWTYSKYSCTTNRRTSDCEGKFTSDPIVGEFVFNYILNLLNAQNSFDTINTPEELQSRLLSGDTFAHIKSIDSDGLNDLFNVLLSGNIKGNIYGKGAKLKTSKKEAISELANLRKEKQKIERALDRLTNLYLYSEAAMSETEFIIQKARLVESLEDLNEQIGMANSEEWQQSVSDEIFIQRASEFIISQKLTGRNYVFYKNLATSVDTSVLKTFVNSIIDNIVMDKGRVRQITFKNGLSHKFIFHDN